MPSQIVANMREMQRAVSHLSSGSKKQMAPSQGDQFLSATYQAEPLLSEAYN